MICCINIYIYFKYIYFNKYKVWFEFDNLLSEIKPNILLSNFLENKLKIKADFLWLKWENLLFKLILFILKILKIFYKYKKFKNVKYIFTQW